MDSSPATLKHGFAGCTCKGVSYRANGFYILCNPNDPNLFFFCQIKTVAKVGLFGGGREGGRRKSGTSIASDGRTGVCVLLTLSCLVMIKGPGRVGVFWVFI